MVFVLKPLTQSQQQGNDVHEEYKHKSRLVICGNFATWGEHSTTTTNLDALLLRLMLSLACSRETTWSSVDITSAFLNADIHEDDTILITPPPILVKMDIVKPNTVWRVKKAIYGLREAPRLWQPERDQQLQDLDFVYNDRSAHLVQSYIHPGLWFIAEGPRDSSMGIPPFDNRLRSDEWTAKLHKHKILGYVGVYVDDLLIAGPRSLSDTLIRAVQGVWKTSAPEHLGPDPDCVPILRFLGMNLERVDEDRSKELDMPVGSILLSQMEYILDVLLKFEPSLQLKTRTTPGNQESFSPSSLMSHDQAVAEHLESLDALIAEDVTDADATLLGMFPVGALFSEPPVWGRQKGVTPTCSDFPVFFRFVPICVPGPGFREYPDLFRFVPISSDLFSTNQGNPFLPTPFASPRNLAEKEEKDISGKSPKKSGTSPKYRENPKMDRTNRDGQVLSLRAPESHNRNR